VEELQLCVFACKMAAGDRPLRGCDRVSHSEKVILKSFPNAFKLAGKSCNNASMIYSIVTMLYMNRALGLGVWYVTTIHSNTLLIIY
jgi:hypothetical protein